MNTIALSLSEWLLLGILAVVMVILGTLVYMTLRVPPASSPESAGNIHPFLERIANEPVRVRTAVLALLAIGGSFGLPLSDSQQAIIVAAVLALLALFSETTRAKVTPVRKLSRTAVRNLKKGDS